MKSAHTQIVEQARHYGLNLMSNMNNPIQEMGGNPQGMYGQMNNGYMGNNAQLGMGMGMGGF